VDVLLVVLVLLLVLELLDVVEVDVDVVVGSGQTLLSVCTTPSPVSHPSPPW
jgi:hypothetical protein